MNRIVTLEEPAATLLEPVASEEKPPLDFSTALISAPDFLRMEMEARPRLLGNWMRQGDMGYLFAPRGAGKSWMAMLIGNAVAKGESLGEWEAGDSVKPVYYFDAEMNLADMQERFRMLHIEASNFRLLSNEQLFTKGLPGVDIANLEHQRALSDMLPNKALFIIDNLSTAQIGMSENDNDSFDSIRDWLLSLRHRGITVMIVHHAGRSGAMRGASRREDMAHWIVSLKEAGDPDEEGTKFITSFNPPAGKCRNCPAKDALPMKWTLSANEGKIAVACELHSGPDALLSHVRNGVRENSLLSELLGVSPGTVSKWAAKLIQSGKIRKSGRDYAPAEE